jgi:ketosteroid isomerase-like protein
MSQEEQIRETSAKIREALFNQDTDALKKLFAEDYRSFDIRGNEEDRNLILDVYRPGGVLLELYEMDQDRVDVFEDVGFFTGRGRVRGRYGDQIFEHTIRFTDIYRRMGGHWRLWLSHATEIQEE